MTARREAWWMPSAGSLRRLALREEAAPEPGPGEVRVRVSAIGLNFADVFAALGLYSATPRGRSSLAWSVPASWRRWDRHRPAAPHPRWGTA